MIPSRYALLSRTSLFAAAPIYHCAATESTMDDARRLPSAIADGTILWADYQHAGRGRAGRGRWHAAAVENLLLTLVVSQAAATPGNTQHEVGSIPLRAGLAVAQAAVALGIDASDVCIKWPNDVLVNGRKLCGVLCEGVDGRYHIGIGLNVNQSDFSALAEQRAELASLFAPTSLALISGRRFERESVLGTLLTCLRSALRNPAWQSEVNERLYRRGADIRVRAAVGKTGVSGASDAADSVQGRVLGVNADGTLQVQLADGSPAALLQPDDLCYAG